MNEVAKMEEENLRAFYDAETQKVVEILKKANPEKIIRFGSVTRGDLRQDSDLDLCILIERDDQEPCFRLKQRLFKLLFAEGYRHPISLDLHVYSPEEYLLNLRKGDPFLKEINKGEVVYAKGRST
ncbi:MAG: nucleotidyltransferase domain-containing protein [Chloroflexota bacterium]|nr:nucleotidyltransferase domain-containing protein [Chloroflexota bacterium]